MEHSLYPVPPRFTVRRLVLMDLAAICTLYGACGATPPGAHAKRLPRCLAKANGGAVFWAESWLSAAPVYPPVPPRPRLPLCAARWRPRAFRPVFCCRPPPRPRAGPLPGAFFPCWANASGRPVPPPEKRLAAAVPVKTGGLLLNGFFEAGFTLFLVRPLAALRPHYLLTPPGLRQPAPGTPDEDAVRRVHIPLADTLAVSRLLEQGFCGIALYDGADGQPALRAGTTEPRIRRTRLPHRIYGRTSRKGHAP